MSKFKDIYKRELHSIKQTSKEFGENNPTIAPMLREESSDPDVERLLEGFAYVSAQIQEIIDDQIPEFSGGLIKKFFPQYLRPLPSSTIMEFSPRSKLPESLIVKKGTYFNSIAVSGTVCKFKSTKDCRVDPVSISKIGLIENVGQKRYIEIDFKISSNFKISKWFANDLNLHLGDDQTEATQLYYLLLRGVELVTVEIDGQEQTLPNDVISAGGCDMDDGILPYPGNADISYRILQEYFLMPEKYLYINIANLSSLNTVSESQEVKLKFILKNDVTKLPQLAEQSFILHTVTAVNIFDYDAKPIEVSGFDYRYPIYPDTKESNHFPIYAVKHVQSYQQGVVKPKQYYSIDDMNSANIDKSCFDITNRFSNNSVGMEFYISILNGEEQINDGEETLSIDLECSNGNLPEHLSVGEISAASNNSSSLLNFKNIYAPTVYKNQPEDDDWMWRLQSMLSLNYLSIANAENLRSFLEFYLFLNKGEHTSSNRFHTQIFSIEDVQVMDSERMVAGVSIRGYKIQVKLQMNKFSSKGSVFLFGSILDKFFAMYSTINTFTALELVDVASGERIGWLPKVNNQLLS